MARVSLRLIRSNFESSHLISVQMEQNVEEILGRMESCPEDLAAEFRALAAKADKK